MRWGRAFARPLRTARHLPPLDPNEVAFGGLGFAKMFTRPELVALGDAIGRETRFDEGAPDGVVLCEWAITAPAPRAPRPGDPEDRIAPRK